ncbi:MAG: hypothetical protein CVU43_00070 [Chloroflexi bacterium HGW-Chloroflexi-5]|jgi:glycosyltransferase involved in cell wall biosynthesis|nr:MAG: hypothetical protein CVU43_00070 [Chloroflexi bacterium HGW-Chloroflexi-5]
MDGIGIAGPLDLNILCDSLDLLSSRIPRGLGGTVLPPIIIELVKRGHRIIVFTLDQSINTPLIIEKDLIKICVCPSRQNRRARDFFALERRYLVKCMQNEKISLINAHWTYEFALASLSTGIPTLVTAHDTPLQILRFNPSPYQLMRTLMAFIVINNTKAMTVVSPYIQNQYIKRYGYHKSISIIPNGLSKEIFSLTNYSNKKSKNNLVFASALNGWSRLKNSKNLIRAFSIVHQNNYTAELWLFGNGHSPNGSAQIWAEKNKVSEGVRFWGNVDNKTMLQLFAENVDILVHPSLEESFCMSIIEALALGLPVIGGINSGAVPSTLDFGKAGVLVDVRSPSKIADAMLELGSNNVMFRHYAETGRAYAHANFRIERVVDLYEAQYIDLVQSIL